MPCTGPKENTQQVEKAYDEVLHLLIQKYKIDSMPASFCTVNIQERYKRKLELKEAIRRLFELDSWEGF